MSIVGRQDGSYWYEVINDEEGARNIVKMLVKGDPNDPENTSMVLLAHGTGAKSLITGTPAMMTQSPGMPQGMPPGMEPPAGRGTGSGA